MPKPVFQLTSDGYFSRGAERIVPVGVNYWPSSCGVEMWRRWPAAEIRRDLDLVRALGLNCVRFFLRWEDFEPTPGRYSATAFRRLAELLGWCRARGLLAHPSLFVGWMSGGIFRPRWMRGRNIF
jgi:endo-1,4-beta-mannosidase